MANYPAFSDIDLMRLIGEGDQHALAQLYQRYGGPVYSLAFRVLQQPGLAEEATQDTFVKVWRQSHQWDSTRGRLLSWLLTVARYTAIDRLRAELRQATTHAVSLDGMPAGHEIAAPDDPAWRDGRILRMLLKELPPEQALLIEMGFFQGMTHRELAEKLELPLGTVKTRVRLGLQKLRAMWLEAIRQKDP